jgi:CheY-like chemotaxis protein
VDEGAGGKYLGDEMELKQVLLSLLDNAVKYTDAPGRVRFAVSALATTEVRRVISFVVSDTGIGMDEEFLTKVFGVFAREDASSTSRHGGGGLSLAVAKRMVDQMGGSIHADSKKGEGSIFTITLPLDVVEGPEVVEDTESIEDAEGEPEELLEGYRILIAEDIDENAEIVMDLLDLEGAETERAENGAIAVDMFSSSEVGYYDAILMDLRMPVMDGLEATRRIRALEREDAARIPIVALTADAFESDMRQTEAAGMNAHMAKPADADLMYRTLRQLIQATPA